MVEANRRLKDAEELDRKSGPAPAQDLVVGVLNAYTGEAATQIERVKQFLHIEKGHVPGPGLPG
jgi:hypothetical protein